MDIKTLYNNSRSILENIDGLNPMLIIDSNIYFPIINISDSDKISLYIDSLNQYKKSLTLGKMGKIITMDCRLNGSLLLGFRENKNLKSRGQCVFFGFDFYKEIEYKILNNRTLIHEISHAISKRVENEILPKIKCELDEINSIYYAFSKSELDAYIVEYLYCRDSDILDYYERAYERVELLINSKNLYKIANIIGIQLNEFQKHLNIMNDRYLWFKTITNKLSPIQ